MAGGNGSPLEKLRHLSKTELLLHKIAMKRMRRLAGKQAAENRKTSGIHTGRDFVLEDHKLKNKVDQLEKEKQQCIHRHKEDAHMFRMSVKLPPQCSQEYWSQYGEKFHANGDFRENYGLLRLPPQPSPREQTGKTRKERQGSCDISKIIKSKPCKTVSDLITLMRRATPTIDIASSDPTACPLSSSSMSGELTQRTLENATSESLHKLRVLLENYEMFVPSESDVEEQEEEQQDKSFKNEVEEKNKPNNQQSRSKSVDDIEKVELQRLTNMRTERLVRSQSAQTNQNNKQGPQRSRKRNSAPARDIAHGALRVQALQPSVCKYDAKNQSLTKSTEALFKSPSKRVPERTESSALPHGSDSEDKVDLDENNGSFQQESSQVPSARTELSFEKVRADSKNDFHGSGITYALAGREAKGGKEEDGDFEGSETLEKESLDTITYCFSERAEYYSSIEENELHIRQMPVRVTSGYPREVTSTSRTSREVCFRRTRFEDRSKSRGHSDNLSPGKISIKNILPEFPFDIEALRRASKKSVINVVNDETNPSLKPQRYWRPKPKSASPFAKRRSTEQDVKEVNKQPDHLAHASVKGRRTSMMVLGKGLIDKKKQERETRKKMEIFFARLDSTKNGETSVLHAAAPTRPNTATLRSKERRMKKQEYQRKTERMYKRAAPWPVQVWC